MAGFSKSLNKYLSRKQDTESHLQIVDGAMDIMAGNIKLSPSQDTSINEILGLSKKKYSALKAKPTQSTAIFNRAKVNNSEFALCRIYTHFGEYCKNILRELYDLNPMLVVGKGPGALQYHEIVSLGEYDLIADHMVEAVFKKLESERSTLKTIQKLISGTNVTIPEAILHEALGFFEIRHLLVHQAGIVDKSFCDRYPDLLRVTTCPGAKLPLTFGLAMRSIKSITLLLETIDSQFLLGEKTNLEPTKS